MAEKLRQLVNLKDLKTNVLRMRRNKGNATTYVRYDSLFDAFFVMYVPPGAETAVFYVNDDFALLYETESMEIVGFQIDDFAAKFVQSHRQLKKTWNMASPEQHVTDFGALVAAVGERKLEITSQIFKAYSNMLPHADEQWIISLKKLLAADSSVELWA